MNGLWSLLILGACFLAVLSKVILICFRKFHGTTLKGEEQHKRGKVTRVVISFLKTAFWIVAILGALIFIQVITEGRYPAGFQTISTERAHAFLFHNNKDNDLPDEVTFTIDGSKAVFHKNTKPYNELLTLLHNGRSEEIMLQAGDPSSFTLSSPCGEMVITSFWIPSHYQIRRSQTNDNYYWIAFPKLTSPGTTFPIFTYDKRVINFILANKDAE